MVDREIIIAKTNAAKKHLSRIQSLAEGPKQAFMEDQNTQDIILFNIQLAVQNCIDIAAHVISEQGLGVPGSNNEMFYCLEENGYINRQIAEKMVKAVGMRNLIVHEYGKLDLERIYQTLQHDINDLQEFLKTMIRKVNQ
ncbi:MAG: DUF86 domain-containing protein [Desulfobacteraceae bacterium]|nr:DUF86 domain-containing protein [Desulfobacteraceae bacterium]